MEDEMEERWSQAGDEFKSVFIIFVGALGV